MKLDALKPNVELFQDRTFRTFFIGSSASKLGDGLIPVAFALVAYQTVGSGYGITLVLLSLWTTRFVTVPLGGRVADSHNRILVALSADVVRLVAQGGLAVTIIILPNIELWHLCVSAALYGVGTGFYIPAQIGLLPQIVSHERLRDANSLLSIVADISALAGPAMSGLVLVSLGFTWILWLDCATFAVNAVALVRLISLTELQPIDSAGNGGAISRVLNRKSSNSGFIAGFRLIPSFRWFGFGLLLWFVISLGIGVVAVTGPAIAVESLGGPYAWAVLSTCLALGSLVGSVVVATSARSFPWWKAAAFVTVGFCTQLVTLTSANVLGLAAVAAVFAFAAAAMAACGVIWGTEYQRRIPGEYLSRLGSLASFSNSVGVPIGMVVGGILAGHIDFLIISVVMLVLAASAPAVIAASRAVGAAAA